MHSYHLRVVLSVGALALAICSVAARADTSAATACKALETADFSSVRDAPTQIMSAGIVEQAGDIPIHCNAQGYVAPSVGFELKLPTSNWNGKFIEIGCGALCGTTQDRSGWCGDALRRGYACIFSDRGHKSTGSDALWAYNNLQAKIDFGFRAAHVTALAGKAVTQHYYGDAPRWSYFMGCSGGGRQGLTEAQRFAWDFDGIVAMDPGPDLTGGHMTALWRKRVTTGHDGKPLFTPADRAVLQNAVIAKCDAQDGLEDGIIGDPRTCKFDPAELTCGKNQKSGCLSQEQVTAAKKVYGGPVTSTGEKLFHATLPGAETGSAFTGTEYSDEFFRYLGFMPDAGPDWKVNDFDFDNDYKRLGMMEMLYASDNPDLRKFKARGGKLIITQGWDDSGSWLPLRTLDYYEMVEKAMGGRASTQEFARLFMAPGRAHCGGGPGANAVDYLGHLEDWVERGSAPDMMISAHVQSESRADYLRLPQDPGKAKFTRPLYPHPLRARYRGNGDPNDYRSFEPVEPGSK